MDKFPPIEKIYEAYSAVADGRVNIEDDTALVKSSDGKKEYNLKWSGNTYVSNDNASYWLGYAGYPVIAVLMLTGKLKYDKLLAARFKGINWKEINKSFKNNYTDAVGFVLQNITGGNYSDIEKIRSQTLVVYEELKRLPINIRRSLPKTK